MKVIYVKTIQEKMDEALTHAAAIGKQVDYFALTKEEFRQLTGFDQSVYTAFRYFGHRVEVIPNVNN